MFDCRIGKSLEKMVLSQDNFSGVMDIWIEVCSE